MLALLFTLLFGLWAVMEGINHLVGKGARLGEGRPEDGGSYWLLIMAVFLAFGLAFSGRAVGAGWLPEWVRYGGLGLMAAGIALRQWAVYTLGRHFSVVVAIEKDHRLIQTGPYRWLRHPAYTGGLLAVIGLHLVMGNGWTLLLAMAVLLPAFVYRLQVEEQALLAHFGESYQAYQQRTWGLLPWW
jgi:protein-S-isoprenylcysteine O-methyltransferase Ste14